MYSVGLERLRSTVGWDVLFEVGRGRVSGMAVRVRVGVRLGSGQGEVEDQGEDKDKGQDWPSVDVDHELVLRERPVMGGVREAGARTKLRGLAMEGRIGGVRCRCRVGTLRQDVCRVER